MTGECATVASRADVKAARLWEEARAMARRDLVTGDLVCIMPDYRIQGGGIGAGTIRPAYVLAVNPPAGSYYARDAMTNWQRWHVEGRTMYREGSLKL